MLNINNFNHINIDLKMGYDILTYINSTIIIDVNNNVFHQISKEQEESQRETDARAARDLQTRWSAMDNNFKVAQNAKILGRMDREDHEAAVTSMKPMLDAAADHPPITFTDDKGVEQSVAPIGDKNVGETDSQDVQKYPASVWNRTLDGTVPRTGTDGQPVYIDWRGRSVPKDTPGAHQAWDNTYTMVHKDTQIPITRVGTDGKSELQPAVKALLPYAGIIPGVSKQLESAAAGQTLNYGTLSKMTQQANDISMLQSELNSSFTRLNGDKKKSDPGYIDTEATNKAVMNALRDGDLTLADLHNFQKAIVGHGGSTEPWEQLTAMTANPDPAVQNSAPKIAALFNMGSDPKDAIGGNLERMKANALIEKDKEVSEAKDDEKQMVPDGQVKTLPMTLQRDWTGLKPGQVNDLVQQAGPHPSQKVWKEVMIKAAAMAKQNTDEGIKQQSLDDKQQEQLFNYGQVGNTKLTLDNAPGSFLVNTKTGSPIPLKMASTLKASQTEINREQFARSAMHSMSQVKNLIETTEAQYGPIAGPISDFMAKHGLGDKYTQELKDYMNWAQSAATGAHVGGRFNVQIMNKAETALNGTMNKDQLYGAIDATSNVMQGYADNGGRLTVEQWKSLPVGEQQRLMAFDKTTHPGGNTAPKLPIPATVPKDNQGVWRNAKGAVTAYKDAKGTRVELTGGK